MAAEEVIRSAQIGGVIRWYPEKELAGKALERCGAPLPTPLRCLISAQVHEGSGDHAFDVSLLRDYDFDQDEQVSVELAVGFYSHLKNAPTAAQMGLNTEDVLQLQREFAQDPRLPNASHLQRHLAAQRERAAETIVKELKGGTRSLIRRTAPAYAAGLVFDPDVLRANVREERFYWETSYREPNAPLARTFLQHWDEHCALWDFPAQIARSFHDGMYQEGEFWDELAPFIEKYPKPRQALLEWAREHSLA